MVPTYKYRCGSCLEAFDEVHPISNYPKKLDCDCGGTASLVICGGNGFSFKDGFFRPGPDSGAGQVFNSAAERKEWMRANGMHEIGPEDSSKYLGYREDIIEAKKDRAPEPPPPAHYKPERGIRYSGGEPTMPSLPGIKFTD